MALLTKKKKKKEKQKLKTDATYSCTEYNYILRHTHHTHSHNHTAKVRTVILSRVKHEPEEVVMRCRFEKKWQRKASLIHTNEN